MPSAFAAYIAASAWVSRSSAVAPGSDRDGDPDRAADDDRVGAEQDRPAQLAQDPVGRDDRLVGVADMREEHRELVAALAADDVLGPDRTDQPLGDPDEDLVPGRVAVGVVDPLEIVEVDEEQADRPATATRRARARSR